MNTYGEIGNATAGWYSAQLLSHAVPVIILERYGLTKPLPKNQTKVIEFRRSKAFPAATTPLIEGVTPNPSDFGYDTITVQIQQYGDYSEFTDVVADLSKDNVLRDIVERQGEQIGETREALTWDVVRAGTSVFYGQGTTAVTARTGIDDNSVLDAARQRAVISLLQQQKAKKFTRVLSGSENYETFAIEACYICVGHTDMEPTVRDLQGTNQNDAFTPYSRYGEGMKMISPHELGNFERVRYVLSPDLTPFRGAGATASNAEQLKWRHTGGKFDVYPLVYLGREAYGCIPLRGMKAVRPMVLQPRPRGGDPLGQRASAGWKFYFACTILNEAWLCRLEVACPK